MWELIESCLCCREWQPVQSKIFLWKFSLLGTLRHDKHAIPLFQNMQRCAETESSLWTSVKSSPKRSQPSLTWQDKKHSTKQDFGWTVTSDTDWTRSFLYTCGMSQSVAFVLCAAEAKKSNSCIVKSQNKPQTFSRVSSRISAEGKATKQVWNGKYHLLLERPHHSCSRKPCRCLTVYFQPSVPSKTYLHNQPGHLGGSKYKAGHRRCESLSGRGPICHWRSCQVQNWGYAQARLCFCVLRKGRSCKSQEIRAVITQLPIWKISVN